MKENNRKDNEQIEGKEKTFPKVTRTTCFRCGGIAVFPCPYCGSQRKSCKVCHGKVITCKICSGRGYLENEIEIPRDPQQEALDNLRG